MMLKRDFFQTDPLTAAQELLGWRLCYNGCEGVIVETEAYAGLDDAACHTWRRPSARKFVEQHEAGTAYVYLNYGVHWLFNILVKGKTPKEHGFVLVRAVEPHAGLSSMRERRSKRKKENFLDDTELCSGPGKLTQAFGIDASHHGVDLFNNAAWSFEKEALHKKEEPSRIVLATPRIGISLARERLWRFVLKTKKAGSQK